MVIHAELAIIMITARPKTVTLSAEQTGRLTEWCTPQGYNEDQYKSVVCALKYICINISMHRNIYVYIYFNAQAKQHICQKHI